MWVASGRHSASPLRYPSRSCRLPPTSVLTAVGTVAFIVALTQAKTYWLMYGLSTFPLVMLLAAPGQIGFEAEEPGFQILLSVGLLTHLGRPAERASPSSQQRGGPSLRTAGGFLPSVASQETQSPWFLKTPKFCQPPFLH